MFFIDDLDRCQPKVALSLLEALKLYLDFPGCVYVLGVDRQPLEAAIGSSYAGLDIAAESYLDKIVQVPFTIPRIHADAMKRYVDEWIPNELDSCRELLANAGADDPRQVKRILNSLLINHRLVDLEQFADGYDARILTVLILIQNFAPTLYRLVRLNPALVHDVYRGKSDDASDAQRALWSQYVATRPRFEAALRLFELPATLDITPYLTLTTAVGQVPGGSQRYLEEVIRRHVEWLDSGGAKGEMANLTSASLGSVSWAGLRLSRANLSATDLTDADLSGTDLDEAMLDDATLRSARLTRAQLRRAALRHALLTDADLAYADLGDADLAGARLTGANMTGANLRGANLAGAELGQVGGATFDATTRWPVGYDPGAGGGVAVP